MKSTLRIGTRASRLALIQADTVRDMLEKSIPGLTVEIHNIKTEGDIDRDSPLASFGGRGAFVRSIETALLDGRIDAAVHSLKDLPSGLPDGLVLGAVPVREDVRDIISTATGCCFDELPEGAVIATGSDRRRLQIANLRPDLTFTGIRGNVETRLSKLEQGVVDAVVLAAAGMHRLGLVDRIDSYFEPEDLIPAPCQGAIGVECRTDDLDTQTFLSCIDNNRINLCVTAERVFIATLGMGCHTPVACCARWDGDSIKFMGYVCDEDRNLTLSETETTTPNNVLSTATDMANRFASSLDNQ